ncbi:putative secreted protein [Propionispora sp. 2/2-37]|uniref:hypothetical protein n=1 Tax=Propionispora sp. 2/2-37 TaxID=1677858 RepID=UPI0006BB8EC8|nr:hypothetical protein [Propionispora sp. 2/2-37]CUH94751.1 putative secreted protein [Propionispora sp. 2/2-37]
MRKNSVKLIFVFMMLLWLPATAYTAWGWEPTDDPFPFYHQDWGKWYRYEDTKVFMVQIDESTYKYVFKYNDEFIGGWVTQMPMHLP